MQDLIKKHPIAVALSIVFHLLLVAFFVFGVDILDFSKPQPVAQPIVKATVIDESKIKAEAERLKKQALEKKRAEQQRKDELKKKQLAEEKKLSDLKKKRELEEQKAKEAARQAKLKAENEKKKALEQKKKAEAERKRQEALAKKKKAEAEAARKKEEQRQQAERERMLREQAAQEEQEMRAQAAVTSHTAIIQQKVQQYWIQPPGQIDNLQCLVRVRLIPGGEVIDVQIIQSSGNAIFDRSVELATRKASPLPLPSDPSMFKYFRTLEFNFNPGG